MKATKVILGIVVTSFFVVGSTWAADSASTASSSDFLGALKNNSEIWYLGEVNGPAVGNMSWHKSGNDGVETKNPVDTYNQFPIKFNSSPKVTLFVNPRFNYAPFNPVGTTLLEPRAGLSIKKVMKAQGYSMDKLTLRTELGVTDTNLKRENGFRVSPTLITENSYSFDDSRFSLGLITLFRHKIYVTDNDLEENLVYLEPAVNFQATPTLAPSLNLENAFTRGRKDLFVFKRESVLKTKLSWDASPAWNLTPYVAFLVGDPHGVQANNTALGIEIAGKLY